MMQPKNPRLDSRYQFWQLSDRAQSHHPMLPWCYIFWRDTSPQWEHLQLTRKVFKPAVRCPCKTHILPKDDGQEKVHSLAKICANLGQGNQFGGSWPNRSRSVQKGASLDPPHPSTQALYKLQQQQKEKSYTLTEGWYFLAVWKSSSFCEVLVPVLDDQHELLQ